MSSSTTAVGGSFSPIDSGPIRTDAEFDLENLTDEEREVVTADEFIVFGRASIEQWNDPAPGEEPIYIEMDALEERLDQLLALNNLSRRHDDTRVGEFFKEHTLESSSTVHLDDGQTLRFDEGDTLRTQVIREGEPLPDGSGPAQEDALWLVANVFGRSDVAGSIISQETRLGAYYGYLDGFSVTVQRREYDPTDDGAVISDVDFLAVTIGEDELIKNKGSTFGVAEFQARFGLGTDDASTTPCRGGQQMAEDPQTISDRLTMSVFKHLFSQSRDGLTAKTIRTARQNELSLDEAATEVAGEDDADAIEQQAEERLQSISENLETIEEQEMGRDDLAAEVADELGMDVEEIHALFEELEAAASDDTQEGDPDDEPDEEEEDDDDDDDVDQQGLDDETEELVEQAATDAVEDALESRLEEQSFVTEEEFSDRLDDLSQQLDDSIDGIGEDIASNLEQQMQQGGTPDPSGGNANAETDLKAEVDSVTDAMTFGGE